MRARRVAATSEFRLFQDEQEIGYVDETRVMFQGFASREDAALAASVAHRALARRRGQRSHSMHQENDILIVDQGSTQAVISTNAVQATLLPPQGEEELPGWGFEIQLLPEERFEVFALARTRLIWRALRGTGIYRRMRQFGADHVASA
jgi:hypothetical protein